MSPWGQIHRQVDVPAKSSEPSSMEPPYGGDVASNGADGQVFITTGERLLDDPADEPAADALIPNCLCYDDRLNFATRPSVEQTGQTYDPAMRFGHPGADPLRHGEVAIESSSRVVATDRGVPIDSSVVLRELRPQISTSTVVAIGVVANDEVRRVGRLRQLRNRHCPIVPGTVVMGVCLGA
jgi:hypothetical protein